MIEYTFGGKVRSGQRSKSLAFELVTTMVRLMREGKSYNLDILLESKLWWRKLT